MWGPSKVVLTGGPVRDFARPISCRGIDRPDAKGIWTGQPSLGAPLLCMGLLRWLRNSSSRGGRGALMGVRGRKRLWTPSKKIGIGSRLDKDPGRSWEEGEPDKTSPPQPQRWGGEWNLKKNLSSLGARTRRLNKSTTKNCFQIVMDAKKNCRKGVTSCNYTSQLVVKKDWGKFFLKRKC